MRRFGSVCIILSLAILSACASEEAPFPTVTDSVTTTDPLSGTWKGDWGLSGDNRNPVTLALTWDGTNLAGTVNPGPDAVAVTKGSFAPDTGSVMIEATGNSSKGVIHYTAEGKLSNGAISGTWMDGDKKGDFRITKVRNRGRQRTRAFTKGRAALVMSFRLRYEHPLPVRRRTSRGNVGETRCSSG